MRLASTLCIVFLACALLHGPGHAVAHEQTELQIAALDRQIESRPLDAGLHMQRGEMHRMLGQWDAARRDYERSLRLDPGLTAVYLCEGRLWMDEGLPERALAALDRYIASHPEDPAGRIARGRALVLLGRNEQAAGELERGLALETAAGIQPQPDLYLELARALIATTDDNRARALVVLEGGLSRLARPVALELEALSIERAMGRTDAALIRLDRLAAASARAEIWLVRRAEILEQAGRTLEAALSWRDASSAIDRLPASRRTSAAVAELKSAVDAALLRLPHPSPAGEP